MPDADAALCGGAHLIDYFEFLYPAAAGAMHGRVGICFSGVSAIRQIFPLMFVT